MKNVAANIRAERARRKWTQAELSERAGLSVSFVGDVEGEKQTPGLESLQRLSTAFGVPITDLMQDAAPATPPQAQKNDRGPTVREPQITTAVNGDSDRAPAATGNSDSPPANR